MTVTGRHDLQYRVIYQDNNFFWENERPQDTHYLMSYTDHIRLNSQLSLTFSQFVDLHFDFTATETMLIKSGRGANGDVVVHEETNVVAETSGAASGREFTWGADAEGETGGFVVEPGRHIELYKFFVESHQDVMHGGGGIPERVNFAAELRVAFKYTIRTGEINRVLTRELVIPLSTEVYKPDVTGERDVEAAAASEPRRLSFFVIVLIVLWLSALALGICYCARRLILDAEKRRGEADATLQRYANLIVRSKHPVDVSGHSVIQTPEFKELLKLSAGLNRNIICYHGGDKTEFYVFDNDLVYCYGSPEPPPSPFAPPPPDIS